MLLHPLPCALVLSGLSFGLALPAAAQQPPQLQYLKAKIQRNVSHTLASDKITYLAQPYPAAALTIQSYPTYVYYEPAGVAGQFELRPDTTAGYAALYRAGKLVLTARTGVGGLYSFYPVNPPAAEKNYGLGSRDSASYDVKLVQATLPYRASAFIFLLPPRLSPDLMGFYDHGTLHFVDEQGQVYHSVEELIVAKFGSRTRYAELLAGLRKRAEEDRKWYEAHHSGNIARPLQVK